MSASLAPAIKADPRTFADGFTKSNDNVRGTELRPTPAPDAAATDGSVERLKRTVIPLTLLGLGGIATLAWSAFLIWMLARLVLFFT